MQKSKMHSNSAKERHVAVFRVFAAMLLVTLLSFHVISGVFANYAVRSDGGSGAKVAVFRVDADGETTDGLQQSIKSDKTGDVTTYLVQIKNESEVRVKYSVEISFKDGMGQYFTASLNSGRFTDTMRWNDVGELTPDGTVSCTLEIKVKDEAAFANAHMESETGNDYSDDFGFETYVTFTQID